MTRLRGGAKGTASGAWGGGDINSFINGALPRRRNIVGLEGAADVYGYSQGFSSKPILMGLPGQGV